MSAPTPGSHDWIMAEAQRIKELGESRGFQHWVATADEGLSGLAARAVRAAYGLDRLTESCLFIHI